MGSSLCRRHLVVLLITFGRTRGSEEREEKEALREAFEAEFKEAFEAEVSDDFL